MKSLILLMMVSSYFLHQNPANPVVADHPSIMGIFVGRTPCKEISRELKIPAAEDCQKLKWAFTFYQDPATGKPTTYQLAWTRSRQKLATGKWFITHGAETGTETIVYKLVPDNGGEPLYLLKADENVLFFLDNNKRLLVGNDEFSYTLNRRTP